MKTEKGEEKERQTEGQSAAASVATVPLSPSSQLGSEAKGSLGKSSPRLEPAALAVATTASL